MFYALSDWQTGDYPTFPTTGFYNTKIVIAFQTRSERDNWLSETNLLTAKALTRLEALKRAQKATGNEIAVDGGHIPRGSLIVALASPIWNPAIGSVYVVLRANKRGY